MKIAMAAENLSALANSDNPKAQKFSLHARLTRIAAESERSYLGLLSEIIRLRYGKGRISLDEYVGLRLYDNLLYGSVDKKAFIGFEALRKIWIQANYRFDSYGLVNNKIASDILFGTYGFPIMPTIAIFHEQMGRKSSFLLRSEDELRGFLKETGNYPLFGKPMAGHQSLGTASISHYEAARNSLVTTTGHRIPFDIFLKYVKAHAASGYIFQRRVSPHAAVKAMCGDRLATVRLLTTFRNGKPELVRACWKIPAGINIADNFWRPGNLLASLDLETGQVLRVVRATEKDFEPISDHPDTRVPLTGIIVPHWQEIVRLALEGASLIEDVALIGWDIAPVDSGAIIVEINETPDFKLHQLADRRGMMDADLSSFLMERKMHAADWLQKSRRKKRIVTELVIPSAPVPSGAPATK